MNSRERYLLSIGKAAITSAQTILNAISCHDYFVLGARGTDNAGLRSVYFGTHPVPDRHSLNATRRLLSWLGSLPPAAHLLTVISGGTSALLVQPDEGIGLSTKSEINDLLLRCGASIHEINVVRKHLSSVKGGRLATRTRNLNNFVLVISDVIGDDLATIGSGPFFPDNSTFSDAIKILERYEVWDQIRKEAQNHLLAGVAGKVAESPKPGSIEVPHLVIASNRKARVAAAQKAAELGFTPAESAKELSGLVEDAAALMNRETAMTKKGMAVIYGGEVTVRVRGSGRGGRNQHFALLMCRYLQDRNIAFAAAGTDGIDGNSPAAGAWCDGLTLKRSAGMQLDYEAALQNHDSYSFFHSLKQTIETGPSGTNVMDLYVMLT